MKAAFEVNVDWDDMEDCWDFDIYHVGPDEEKSYHICRDFIKLPCPCQPRIEIHSDYIRVCHRRMQ